MVTDMIPKPREIFQCLMGTRWQGQLPEANYLSNPPTASSLWSALQQYINPSHGRKIHSHVLKTGYEPGNIISIKLLVLHIKCSCLAHTSQGVLWNARTVSAYNFIISGYVEMGRYLKYQWQDKIVVYSLFHRWLKPKITSETLRYLFKFCN